MGWSNTGSMGKGKPLFKKKGKNETNAIFEKNKRIETSMNSDMKNEHRDEAKDGHR